MKTGLKIVTVIAFVGLGTTIARADADAAKGYVKEAQALVEKNDLEGAGNKLELADTELDGVPAADKAPVDASIKAIRTKIAEAAAAANKPKYQRQLTRVMDDAEGAIGNLVIWSGIEERFTELKSKEEAKVALGADLDAAAKKFGLVSRICGYAAARVIYQGCDTERLRGHYRSGIHRRVW